MTTPEAAERPNESSETIRVVTVINPALMSLDEACAYLGLPKGTVYQWRSRRPGYFPSPVRIGRGLRFRKADLDAWIEACVEDAPGNDWESERGTASHPMPSMTRRSGPRRAAG